MSDNHILLIDNYDSFSWNVYQFLSLQGANVTVVRSRDVTLDQVKQEYPDITHLVISPGPGHPLRDSGISIPAIEHYAGKIPILGVCMGLQCIFAAYGGTVDKVGEIVHGKTSKIMHDGRGIFQGVGEDINGTRYHSLAGSISTLPSVLEVSCRTPRVGQKHDPSNPNDGIVMGIRHKTYTLDSVQYHPESILSDQGQVMLANFLKLKGGTWDGNPGFGLSSSEREKSVSKINGRVSPAAEQVSYSKSSSAPTILTRIYNQRRQDVEKAKATPGSCQSDLTALLDLHIDPPQIDIYLRLSNPTASSIASTSNGSIPSPDVALMAEVKRASPSKGDILPPSSPLTAATIALSYAQAGASVISVLTEPTWFKGTLGDMAAVRQVISTLPQRPAVLRKDFIFDTYQIDEARLHGADTVLLIVAMLDDKLLKELYDYARHVRGMEPLVEVNNAEELKRALKIGAKIVGVNNRNLHDFNVDMSTTSRIAEVINEQQQAMLSQTSAGGAIDDRKVILCALSGITGRGDVVKYVQQGVGAVLVGEALMRAEDKAAFVRELLGTSTFTTKGHTQCSRARSASLTGPPDGFGEPITVSANRDAPPLTVDGYTPLVKICGVRTPEAALTAAEAGADFIGLIFVPQSKRYVTIEQAQSIIRAVRERQNISSSDQASSGEQEDDFFKLQAHHIQQNPRKPLFVGVFQNASLDIVQQTCNLLHLDIVQLHGHEPAEWTRLLNVPTFRAFHVDDSIDETVDRSATRHALREAARPGYHSIPLLDTKLSKAVGALSGGAGKAFDWQIARQLTQVDKPGLPILLAGGLEVENVANAVRTVRPWALDVSGGVETKGEKDLGKIKAFIKSAKSAL